MKKQLLLVVALMAAVCAQAQVWQKGVRETAPVLQTPQVQTHRATITPAEGQVWWGYMTEADLANSNSIGTGTPNMTFMTGIYVPANHEQLGSATIKAVRIYVYEGIGATMSDASVWISKTKPATLAAADYSQSVKSLEDGVNDIMLNTPYAVNNEGFYIGYCVTSSNAYPIMCCGKQDAPNAFLISSPGNMEWEDLNGYGFGKLAFMVLAEGANIVDYCATPADFGTIYSKAGEDCVASVKVTNTGLQTISSLSYTVTTNGVAGEEKTANGLNIPFNGISSVNFNLGSESQAAKYAKTITITKINGQPNTANINSASGYVICMTQSTTVVPVIEEFTGTWCGWCPVGFEGLKWVHENYGDKVVLIAVHYNDPMQISDYSPILSGVGSFPSSFINRSLDLYPHPQNFQYVLPTLFEVVVPGKVDVTANWTDDQQKAISMNATSTFYYNDDNANYGVAFVLVEDGLTGTGSSWSQANYLSGNADYKGFDFWYNGASRVSGIEFDHVPVAAWGIQNGMDLSVPTQFTANEALSYSYDADITSKSVIQDKSKLSVVALLIDKSDGSIINAAKTTIGASTGIKGVQTVTGSTAAATYYTLDGKQYSAPQKGLNIVKMADGSVRKVVMK